MIALFVVACTFKYCTISCLALRKSGAVGQFHIPISNKLTTLERQAAHNCWQLVLSQHAPSLARSLVSIDHIAAEAPAAAAAAGEFTYVNVIYNICMSMLPQATEIGTTVMNKWNYVLI